MEELLSPQAREFFSKEGYLKFPSFIPPAMLTSLRQFFDEQMDEKDITDKVVSTRNGQDYVTNLENLCNKENRSCLELLAYPPVLQLAAGICGDDFFLIQEFAVIKNRGDEMPVLWHQDMVHEGKGKCFTMGVYLDDVDEGDGALRVVPGSHRSDRSICELSKEPFIEIPARAGDVLIHDMLLAHSSEPMRKNQVRRVIYFEFLSAAHVRAEGIYSEELISRRSKLLWAAHRYYESRNPGSPSFDFSRHPGYVKEERDLQEVLAEIYRDPVGARPSAYCFEQAW